MSKSKDLGQAEVQSNLDEGQAKGYFGARNDAFPLDAHSLQSGPDSPPVIEQHVAALESRVEEVKASNE